MASADIPQRDVRHLETHWRAKAKSSVEGGLSGVYSEFYPAMSKRY